MKLTRPWAEWREWRRWLIEKDERSELAKRLRRLDSARRRLLGGGWFIHAHAGQLPPEGAWRVWLLMAGRGFGKTRAGAEAVSALARENPGIDIALVAATAGEAERVMIQGPSGLLTIARPSEDIVYYPSRGLIEFASGARGFVHSAANPEGLRGPQHHFAWCDELAKWAYPEATWDNLMLGLRLGEGGGAIVTTTPRPIPLLHRLKDAANTVPTGGRTEENADHLPADFIADVRARYGSTRLGRQELDGELIEEVEGALWTRAGIEQGRGSPFPFSGESRNPDWVPASAGTLERVVIGVDPPASAAGDECGIVVCGLDADGVGWVLDDRSQGGLSPEGWAQRVARAAADWSADRVVVETNQGGEMVEAMLRGADCALPVKPVKARFGKGKRAEPVAQRFETGKARFAGAFPALEDQLCGLTRAGGYEGPGRSPDRADAMVWAMTELLLGPKREPRIRRL